MLGVCWIESTFPGSVIRSAEVLFQGSVIKARALLARGMSYPGAGGFEFWSICKQQMAGVC
jgi:hypothetical protein